MKFIAIIILSISTHAYEYCIHNIYTEIKDKTSTYKDTELCNMDKKFCPGTFDDLIESCTNSFSLSPGTQEPTITSRKDFKERVCKSCSIANINMNTEFNCSTYEDAKKNYKTYNGILGDVVDCANYAYNFLKTQSATGIGSNTINGEYLGLDYRGISREEYQNRENTYLIIIGCSKIYNNAIKKDRKYFTGGLDDNRTHDNFKNCYEFFAYTALKQFFENGTNFFVNNKYDKSKPDKIFNQNPKNENFFDQCIHFEKKLIEDHWWFDYNKVDKDFAYIYKDGSREIYTYSRHRYCVLEMCYGLASESNIAYNGLCRNIKTNTQMNDKKTKEVQVWNPKER